MISLFRFAKFTFGKSRVEMCHLPTVVLCMDPNRCSVSGQQHGDQLGLVGQCQDYRCEWPVEAFNSCKGKLQKANKARFRFRYLLNSVLGEQDLVRGAWACPRKNGVVCLTWRHYHKDDAKKEYRCQQAVGNNPSYFRSFSFFSNPTLESKNGWFLCKFQLNCI